MDKLKNQSGQLVIEYVLLIAVSVTAALVITTTLVNRSGDPTRQGFVIRIWGGILNKIGSDIPEN